MTAQGDGLRASAGDALRAFQRDQARRGLASSTVQNRQRTLGRFERWMAPRPILDADMEDIENFLETQRIGKRSRATYLASLHAFYLWAVEKRLVTRDPTEEIPRPRLGRLVPRPVEEGDLVVALAAAEGRMAAWLTLAAYQGLRCVEIAGLRREDVLDTHTPPLLVISRSKGGDQRVMPLHPEVEQALRRHGLPTSGYLFAHRDGRPFKRETVSVYIGRHLRSLGIEASAHQLRHWFGSRLYGSTQDIRLTQEMMGHASPSTTAIYAAWSPAKAAEAICELRVGRDFESAGRPNGRLWPSTTSTRPSDPLQL